jgi:nicotinate-nucleotide--dimethylbenzimidazole phosphoribosyltransferase
VLPVVTEIENTTIKEEIHFENEITETSSSKISSETIQQKIDNKTKPLGALGKLEIIAHQIATIQQTLEIQITKPTLVVFAADHGIANHGVSAYPQEVTRQMVENFLTEGAAINVFCKQNNIDLKIVDAGVNYDFPKIEKLIDKKVAKGTQSFLQTPAMSLQELNLAFQFGKEITVQVANSGANCIGFGEMGIGNTSSASVLMSVLTQIPIADCVGKGTGVDIEKYNRKVQLLSDAISTHNSTNFEETIACFGGFEIIQMAGAMLEAYQKNMIILVDGFIATVSYLIASIKNPEIKKNVIFCHCSSEKAHITLLNYLNAKSLINLEMRLGEGSGVAVAFPIIHSAVAFFNEMASFESAGVSNKE